MIPKNTNICMLRIFNSLTNSKVIVINKQIKDKIISFIAMFYDKIIKYLCSYKIIDKYHAHYYKLICKFIGKTRKANYFCGSIKSAKILNL